MHYYKDSVRFHSLLKTFKYLVIWICRDKYFSSVTQLTGSDINLISRSCYHNESQRKFNQDNFLYAHSFTTLCLSPSLPPCFFIISWLWVFTLSVSQSCHRSQTLNLSSPLLLSASLERKIVAAHLRHSTKFTSSSSHRAAQLSSSESTRHHSQRSSDSFFVRSPSPSVLMRPNRQRLIFSLLEPNRSTSDSRGPD